MSAVFTERPTDTRVAYSEAAYARLRAFIEDGEIDHLGVFPWSKEDGTASAMHPQRVGDELANERASELMEIQAGIRAAKFQAMRGQEIEVVIDAVSDESEFLLDGRHEGQAPEIDGKVILLDVDDEASIELSAVEIDAAGRSRAESGRAEDRRSEHDRSFGGVKIGSFARARVMQATAHDLIASLDLDRDPDEFDELEDAED